MKIAFGMIVFEGDFVLKECLEQVYPVASQILIAEGPVKYWQEKGRTTSTDRTNEIIDNFPDPENKIKIVHGKFSEKDEQCNAYIKFLRDDIDYLWNLDSDEVYKTEDLKKIIELLEKEEPSSVSVRSCTFYGGLNDYLTGFELNKDNFKRIFRITKGSTWLTHRPPTINYPSSLNVKIKHIDGDMLFNATGAQMYHYSYVFPDQVKRKIQYYLTGAQIKDALTEVNAMDNYFQNVYMPWITGTPAQKQSVEDTYNGVHEFKPHTRGPCRTAKFQGQHPESIINNIDNLEAKIKEQLKKYIK